MNARLESKAAAPSNGSLPTGDSVQSLNDATVRDSGLPLGSPAHSATSYVRELTDARRNSERWVKLPPVAQAVELAVLSVAVLLATGYCLVILTRVAAKAPPPAQEPLTSIGLSLAGLGLLHAAFTNGIKRALMFFSFACCISLPAELVGVKTGVIFGSYVYTDVLGAKVLGLVPWIIPITYFAVLYPSYVVSALLLGPTPVGSAWRRTIHGALLAMCSGLCMTAWDVGMDPVMSGPVRAWVWQTQGQWFGVPFQNFVGWVLTNALIIGIYLQASRWVPLLPLGRQRRWFDALPVLGYGTLWVADVFAGYPLETKVLAPFLMGLPMALALLRLFAPKQEPPQAPAAKPTGT